MCFAYIKYRFESCYFHVFNNILHIMRYNYPRLKLYYECLYKYDLIDSKVQWDYNLVYTSTFSQLESSKIENIELLHVLMTDEWFHGQKSATENYSLTSVHPEKSIRIKLTIRKFGFWNFLDICLSSIFTTKADLQYQFYSNYSRKSGKYCVTFPLAVISESVILPKIKEKLSLENNTKVSTNFYNLSDFLDTYFTCIKTKLFRRVA
uniref:Uncharacterized protein n=1 Tax=Sirodotia delicatula TaxID=386631 RepID=A0A343UY43_9FLOR|nr:hypothetical protein [Sirodotia delicatula]AVK39600.1 hypothetical protein [Sirodotia delicatula]